MTSQAVQRARLSALLNGHLRVKVSKAYNFPSQCIKIYPVYTSCFDVFVSIIWTVRFLVSTRAGVILFSSCTKPDSEITRKQLYHERTKQFYFNERILNEEIVKEVN